MSHIIWMAPNLNNKFFHKVLIFFKRSFKVKLYRDTDQIDIIYCSDVQQYFFIRHNCSEKVRPFATFQEIAKIANKVTNMAQDLKFD